MSADAIARDIDSDREERFLLHEDVETRDRSNVMALMLGGAVVAGGLLAFLYYDADGLNDRDALTTGSVAPIVVPGVVVPPPTLPARP